MKSMQADIFCYLRKVKNKPKWRNLGQPGHPACYLPPFLLVSIVVIPSGVLSQGCQMVYFETKNPNLGKFGSLLLLNMLVNFMAIWSILLPFHIFYSHFGIFCRRDVGMPNVGMANIGTPNDGMPNSA
jgi:hypothetical protein